MLTVPQISDRLAALGRHEHDGDARAAFASRLDNLLPPRTISTHAWAVANRKISGPTHELIDYDPNLTPYAKGIMDACDIPEVRVVAVKGPARGVKTVGAENLALKHWDVGPLVNVLWFMQDEDSINDYIDERGEEMLRIHPGVNEKIDWSDRRNSRKRKKIGRATLFYRPATMRSTRSKAAPLIVVDEVDAYQKRVRDAIQGLVQNRQREFGNAAMAYFASHPDAGPDGGIDIIIKDSLVHLWHACCTRCGRAASPAAEASIRWGWNVPELLAQYADLPRPALSDMLLNETRIICPYVDCRAEYDTDQRKPLMAHGDWLQPHQTFDEGVIIGDAEVRQSMGFVIHGFMSPFVNVQETGRDWGMAKLSATLTGNDINLKERTVKDLGETYTATSEAEKTEDWKVVQARLTTPYELRTVPRGVDFLTAFVDLQGDRYEVRVVGWSRSLESWLIDAYAIKQWPAFGKHGAFDNIDPSNRLTDWDVLEEAVMMSRYPLADKPNLYLGIAKTAINNSGVPGVTNMGRVWLANLLGRAPSDGRQWQTWQIQLFQGSPSKSTLTYGKFSPPLVTDDMGRALKTTIKERYPNVHDIKKIIIKRMKIAEPGPGAMHLPDRGMSPRYIRELVSESLVGDDWVRQGPNETWDGWVACECARAWLQPDRPGLWEFGRPDWATPRSIDAIDTEARNPLSVFDRLARINRDTD